MHTLNVPRNVSAYSISYIDYGKKTSADITGLKQRGN